LADGAAKTVTALEDIFQTNLISNTLDTADFEIKASELIKFALKEDMGRKNIEESF
jgi:hypothetical protein